MSLHQPTSDLHSKIKKGVGILGPYIKQFIQKEQKTTTFSILIALFTWLSEFTNIDIPGFQELLNGAHVVVSGDKGELYKYLSDNLTRVLDDNSSLPKKSGINTTNLSSHYSLTPQLRLGHGTIYNCNSDGNLNVEEHNDMFDLLVGVRDESGIFENSSDSTNNNFQKLTKNLSTPTNKSTWIQLEYARVGHVLSPHFVLHGLSYLKYKWSGRNQGPFGSSYYTETGLPYILIKGPQFPPAKPSSSLNKKIKNQYKKEIASKSLSHAGVKLTNRMSPLLGGKRKTRKKRKKKTCQKRKKRKKKTYRKKRNRARNRTRNRTRK